MIFPHFLKAPLWIKHILHGWQLLAPPHRLFLITVGLGALFTGALTYILDRNHISSQKPSLFPTEVGLVADRPLLEKTPLELIHFSFQKLSSHSPIRCHTPVTLADTAELDGYHMESSIAKGQFLCWENIQKRRSSPKTISIRRGYRLMGFQLNNPEILPYLDIGDHVDAILGGEGGISFSLEHLRVVDIIRASDRTTILMEFSHTQFQAIEAKHGLFTVAQVLLKNQEELQKHPHIREKKPKVRPG